MSKYLRSAFALLTVVVMAISTVSIYAQETVDVAEAPSSAEEAFWREVELMQQLLESASNDEWHESGQRIYEAVDVDGNTVSLIITMRRELTPEEIAQGRNWGLVNWDQTRHTLSAGSWTYTVGWRGTHMGNIDLDMSFNLTSVQGATMLGITPTRATPRVLSSPSGFTTTTNQRINSATNHFFGYFTHTRSIPREVREYRMRVGLAAGLHGSIQFTNDLYIWR
jgi:hypothetical protein